MYRQLINIYLRFDNFVRIEKKTKTIESTNMFTLILKLQQTTLQKKLTGLLKNILYLLVKIKL